MTVWSFLCGLKPYGQKERSHMGFQVGYDVDPLLKKELLFTAEKKTLLFLK